MRKAVTFVGVCVFQEPSSETPPRFAKTGEGCHAWGPVDESAAESGYTKSVSRRHMWYREPGEKPMSRYALGVPGSPCAMHNLRVANTSFSSSGV